MLAALGTGDPGQLWRPAAIDAPWPAFRGRDQLWVVVFVLAAESLSLWPQELTRAGCELQLRRSRNHNVSGGITLDPQDTSQCDWNAKPCLMRFIVSIGFRDSCILPHLKEGTVPVRARPVQLKARPWDSSAISNLRMTRSQWIRRSNVLHKCGRPNPRSSGRIREHCRSGASSKEGVSFLRLMHCYTC